MPSDAGWKGPAHPRAADTRQAQSAKNAMPLSMLKVLSFASERSVEVLAAGTEQRGGGRDQFPQALRKMQTAAALHRTVLDAVATAVVGTGLLDAHEVSDAAVHALILGALLPLLLAGCLAFGWPASPKRAHGQPIALVVGAAGGIGSHTARALVQEGFFVVLADLNAEALSDLQHELGVGRSSTCTVDLTSDASVQDLAAHVLRVQAQRGLGLQSSDSDHLTPRLDALVTAAGAANEGLFEDVPLAAHLLAMEVNASGMVRLCHTFLPLLKVTPASRLLSVGSATCYPWALPEYGAYAASKAAQRALTETLALEWAPLGISVCDVIPPAVETPFVTSQATPATIHRHFLTSRVSPATVARAIARTVQSVGGPVHVHIDAGVMALGVLSNAFPCLKVPLVRFLAGPDTSRVLQVAAQHPPAAALARLQQRTPSPRVEREGGSRGR